MNLRVTKPTVALIATLAMLFASLPAHAGFNTPPDKFVRTANNYMRAGTDIRSEHYPLLARYDLVVLPAEAQIFNPKMFSELRRLNADIILLAYVPTKSWNGIWTDELHRELMDGFDDRWWLRSASGQTVSVWPGTKMINAVSPWQSHLPQYVHDHIMSSGVWDGVFYDEFSGNVSWVNGGDIDIHGDGVKDDPFLLDTAWNRSMQNLLRNTREILGPDAVIVTNGDSTANLQPQINGRMFESFPTPWEGWGRWDENIANYLRLHDMVGYTPAFIINANTDNTGDNADFEDVRFKLCSTLLGDGFFGYDFGEQDHGQLWWYDEFDAYLGRPLAGPLNVLSPGDLTIRAGVWRRDFENGVVLVNSTQQSQTVTFSEAFEKLSGSQAPGVNDGSVVSAVSLNPTDGIILLRPMDRILQGSFVNGAFARIFDRHGKQKPRNGFFAYEAPYDGGTKVVIRDIDGDGKDETVVAGGGTLIIDSEYGTRTIRPFGDDYTSDVDFAIGDLEGDGTLEIVVGAGSGGGPHVRVFNADGRLINPGFFAYDPSFLGGVHIAVGDVYGTGEELIIVGAGEGGGPHVRVFNRDGRLIHPGFFAYDGGFRGGVNVAAGDIDGDGLAEIVTGPGPGGGPQVRIFNGWGRAESPGFFAGDPSSRSGIAIALSDMDRDGVPDIIALTTDVFQLSLAF